MKQPKTSRINRQRQPALPPVTGYAVGDLVEVLDEGLAMLRRLMPNMPPNHHGKVAEIWDDGQILVEFPLSGENHSQVAPYPASMVRKRHNAKLRGAEESGVEQH